VVTFLEQRREFPMSHQQSSAACLPTPTESENVTRKAIFEALRSRVELSRPLFSHDVDDDAAVLFGPAPATDGNIDEPGAEEQLWAGHRGWDM
jgi:hypothetical protein